MRKYIDSKKFFASNWIITLTATLIGVFAALYLNERTSRNKLISEKEIVLENIISEISTNQKSLEKSIPAHQEFYDFLMFIDTYSNEDDDLIAPLDSMNAFRKKHPNLIIVKDSTLLFDQTYMFKGDSNFYFDMPHLQLVNIAWKTLKNNQVSTSFGFECLMYLESVDKILNKIFENDHKFLSKLNIMLDTGEKNKSLMRQLNELLQYEKALINVYKASDDELKKCN